MEINDNSKYNFTQQYQVYIHPCSPGTYNDSCTSFLNFYFVTITVKMVA